MPFEQVKRITRELFAADYLLPGLIAVLSRTLSTDLLLVYIGATPEPGSSRMRVITAEQLRDEVLTDYDGPTIGLSAIDHIRPDISTKGGNFARLDRILRRRGRAELLRRTWDELGNYLVAMQGDDTDDEIKRRSIAEIAAIKAPAMIARLSAKRRHCMVAFIQSTGESVRLDELTRDGLPLDDLSKLQIGPEQDVIAFEEIRPLIQARFNTRLTDRYPIELRTVLRRGQVDQELDETRRRLAEAFHVRWRILGTSCDLERAYAIALESRLAHRDVDDLIAVVPSADFERFLTEGTGTYVYRRPLEGRDAGVSAIRNQHLDDAIADLADQAAPVVFSLLPLRALCGSGRPWCDLGPPLRKSARTEILARNAWLLVEDLIERRDSGRFWPGITTKSLYETMMRCCVIFSLADPWRTRQGRRDEWVQGSYRTLVRVIRILQEEHSSDAYHGYYAALEKWYACALEPDNEDVEITVNEVVEQLARCGAPVTADPQPELAEDTERLKDVALPLRQLMSGGARAEAYPTLHGPPVESIPQFVRHATGMAEPLTLLSVPFGSSFREYAGLQERIRRLKTMPMGVRDKADRLAELTAQLDQCRRLIFAPQHEARILHVLLGKALMAADEFISQLRGGTAVELKLQNRWVEVDEDSTLRFSVRNVGSLPARDVELELLDAEAFELRDITFKRSLLRLAPDEERAFSFRIYCATEAQDFRIRCVVSWSHDKQEPGDQPTELTDRQKVTQDFVISTRVIESQPFKKKPNPYVFGVHVQDYRRFFGRRTELDELLGHLAHGGPQNVLIRAPRRAGKTSLLYMVKAVLADTDRCAGVREWFEVPPTWDANLNATVPVLLNLQSVETLQNNATPTAFYHAILGALRDAELRGSFCDWLLNQRVIAYPHFSKAMRELMRTADGRRPVILLDEFDVLDTMAEKAAFYNALRTVVADVQGLTWIVVSALGLYKEIRDYASPLFNIFKIVTMGRMDTEAASKLVTSPWEPDGSLADANLNILPDAVYEILDEAGNYPYFIQMLCSEVVNFVNAAQCNQVRFGTVQQVVERRMMVEGGAADLAFDYMWRGASPTGKLLLLTLMHRDLAMTHDDLKVAARQLLENCGRADLVRVLLEQFDDSLAGLAYVDAVRHVPNAGYAFGVPIFRRLLVRKAERADLEVAAVEQLATSVAGGQP